MELKCFLEISSTLDNLLRNCSTSLKEGIACEKIGTCRNAPRILQSQVVLRH